MSPTLESTPTSRKAGIVLHRPAGYDVLVWLITRGRVRAFRETMLTFVCLQPGETVLDVGCGTGSLAMAAKRQVGPAGRVYGVDASPEMIARAIRKAGRAGVAVDFQHAFAQALPFPSAGFDVVLTTLMLHHLPRKAREELAHEVRRVLKPGGRVLAIDFSERPGERKSLAEHFHRRRGHTEPKEIAGLFSGAGLRIAASGAVGIRDLQYVLATDPCQE